MTTISVALLMAELAGGFPMRPVMKARIDAVAQLIATASKIEMVDAHILVAIAWHESRFDATAIGNAGEIGLMQIAPLSAKTWCGRLDPHIPLSNVLCGARLYKLGKKRCPNHPLTGFHTPARCGPSEYANRINATIDRVTK